jgi:hypothetical protein
MLRKVLSFLILGLVLIGCGDVVVPGGAAVKDVKADSADAAVTVSWTFSGDKTTIKGFRIFRNTGGSAGGYSKLADVLDVNKTSYPDTDVQQGETFKYGVAIINKDNSVGTTINQSSNTPVGPKPVTSTGGSMNGKWTLDAKITETPPGKEAELGKEFFFFLDITETSATLTGTVYFRDPSLSPPVPALDRPFGESKVEGAKNTNGSYTFKLIEKTDDAATPDVNEGKFWTVTATVNAGSTAYTGDYVNVFNFKGTVEGVKVP